MKNKKTKKSYSKKSKKLNNKKSKKISRRFGGGLLDYFFSTDELKPPTYSYDLGGEDLPPPSKSLHKNLHTGEANVIRELMQLKETKKQLKDTQIQLEKEINDIKQDNSIKINDKKLIINRLEEEIKINKTKIQNIDIKINNIGYDVYKK